LDNQLKRVLKYSALVLAGICLALFFYPADGMLWGLAVGLATGIYNVVVLAIRIKRTLDLNPEKGRKHMKKGIIVRFTMILAVLFLVSVRFPFVTIYGVGAGLLIPYCVSTILGVVDTFRLHRRTDGFRKRPRAVEAAPAEE
jgi:hypothetical protein